LIKPIIIFKKIFGSVQFWFYKPETKNQTEPEKKKPNRKKPNKPKPSPLESKKKNPKKQYSFF